jgi:hypothetical protein
MEAGDGGGGGRGGGGRRGRGYQGPVSSRGGVNTSCYALVVYAISFRYLGLDPQCHL